MYDNLGNNVLHYASRRDNERIVSFLIESGCDVNHENKDGATPLHIAAQYSSKQVNFCFLITRNLSLKFFFM